MPLILKVMQSQHPKRFTLGSDLNGCLLVAVVTGLEYLEQRVMSHPRLLALQRSEVLTKQLSFGYENCISFLLDLIHYL
jgi:hypothetical protein